MIAWKPWIELASLLLGMVGALLASVTHWNNSRRERAKWAVQLFEKFYKSDKYKPMRDTLDSKVDTPEIQELVREESSEFTDYLNFFEMVSFPVVSRQLSRSDVLGMFHYYLRCLKLHTAVMDYLHNKENGFEHLRQFLRHASVDQELPLASICLPTERYNPGWLPLRSRRPWINCARWAGDSCKEVSTI